MKVFLNNFNLITLPLRMVQFLRQLPELDVYVIDNASTRPDMNRLYDQPGVQAIRLRKNHGPDAPWLAGIIDRMVGRREQYMLSDGDLDLTGVPLDFVPRLQWYLSRGFVKAGLGIEINDLGESPLAAQVRAREQRFWRNRVDRWAYRAHVDLTLHMRQSRLWNLPKNDMCVRLDRPYVMRHPAWYPELWDEEMRHYIKTAPLAGYWTLRLRRWLRKHHGSV